MSDFLLDAKGIGISFGGLKAVQNFSMQIPKGYLFGLIGPNGAGKTTAFNLLTGVYTPQSGTVHLDGPPRRSRRSAASPRPPRHLAHHPPHAALHRPGSRDGTPRHGPPRHHGHGPSPR
jgi:ABC-type branched-subunit amino acid transport system ATPase component